MSLSKTSALLNPERLTKPFEWLFELPPARKRPTIFLIIFLIVVVPALIFNAATQANYQASRWVSHTYVTEARLHQLLYHIRDVDASIRVLLLMPGDTNAEEHLHQSIELLPQDLNDLQQLTIDSPGQQERVGRLRASVEGRIQVWLQLEHLSSTGKHEQAINLLRQNLGTYPFRPVADEMIKQEDALLATRTLKWERQKKHALLMLWTSVVAQLALFGVVYLISEKDALRRLLAEDISKEAAAHAQSIVDTTPDPLAVLDARLQIRSANKAFSSLYNFSPAPGRHLREVGDGEWDLPELLQRLTDLIPQQREIWDMEVMQTIGGDKRYMVVNARPFGVKGEKGEKLILLAAKDVTVRKRTEEQIGQLNQELAVRVEQADTVNQELEAFSYSVSHDLRAPLRHITGFADMLNNHLGKSDDPKTQRYLKYIRESANQMGTLIDDLLVFSRMGRTEMIQEEVDMGELVREVIKHFNLETEGRRVQFVIENLAPAKGDASMIRLVWMNLIGNAIKYSRQREEARIEIGNKSSEQAERIYYVRDNGVGFNMKYVHKLFGVFQRLHQADEYEGTGIGLANVRRIVQRHGGKVWAQGYVDQGATFYFSLPLEPRIVKDKLVLSTPLPRD